MRTIKLTSQFMQDYKQEKQKGYGQNFDGILRVAVRLLMTDASLPARKHDPPLSRDLKDCRYCYIKPDHVLIYRKNKDDILELVRLGTHNELSIW